MNHFDKAFAHYDKAINWLLITTIIMFISMLAFLFVNSYCGLAIIYVLVMLGNLIGLKMIFKHLVSFSNEFMKEILIIINVKEGEKPTYENRTE